MASEKIEKRHRWTRGSGVGKEAWVDTGERGWVLVREGGYWIYHLRNEKNIIPRYGWTGGGYIQVGGGGGREGGGRICPLKNNKIKQRDTYGQGGVIYRLVEERGEGAAR